jgi:hypothetical protein
MPASQCGRIPIMDKRTIVLNAEGPEGRRIPLLNAAFEDMPRMRALSEGLRDQQTPRGRRYQSAVSPHPR